LERLELGFWNATRDGSYYQKHMAEGGLAVFSDMVMTKQQAAASTSGEGISAWTDVGIEDVKVIELSADATALVYRGHAKRDGTPYSANVTSVYVRRNGEWQMILHQQSANSNAEGR
jgi:hypothetical protein